jgi:hypothetical protein
MNELITTSLFSASSFELSRCPPPDRVRCGVRRSLRNAANIPGTSSAFAPQSPNPATVGAFESFERLQGHSDSVPQPPAISKKRFVRPSDPPPQPRRYGSGWRRSSPDLTRNRFNWFCSESAFSDEDFLTAEASPRASDPNLQNPKNLSRAARVHERLL